MSVPWSPYRIRQLEALLTARDRQLLEALEQYRALSTRLIQRLLFPAGADGAHASSPTATRLAMRVLLRLESHGFIARTERRIGGAARGSSSSTWHLAATGQRLLRARQGDPVRRRIFAPAPAFLAHTLEIADLAIVLNERAAAGHFELLELQTEPACWRSFDGHSGALTLKPDLFVVVADVNVEAHAFIEIDRDTEHLPTIVRKCRLYQQFRQTGAEQAAGGVFPVVIWVVPTPTRAKQLHAAISGDASLDPDQFVICETESAVDALTASLTPKGGTP